MRCMPTNTSTLIPRRTGRSWAKRRAAYFHMAGAGGCRAAGGRVGPPPADGGPTRRSRAWRLLERDLFHVEEHLERVQLEALHAGARRPDLGRGVDEDPGRVGGE